MFQSRIFLFLIFSVVAFGPAICNCLGQHADVFVAKSGGRLVTGSADLDNNAWAVGARVYSAEFDETFVIDEPGFNALASNSPQLPAGSDALPSNQELGWDFYPMRVDQFSSNLLYWNGVDADGSSGLSPSDVRFGVAPAAAYRLSIQSPAFTVTGTDSAAVGGTVDTTDALGFLHRHLFFNLDDGDQNAATLPADGVYLIALRLRMPGLKASLPMYIAFGTPGSSAAALDNAAVPWIDDHADTLALVGDYNKNGVVDAADYTVWRNTVGQSGFALRADGDASGTVDAGDYGVWGDDYGMMSPTTLGGAGRASAFDVPEPSALLFLIVGLGQAARLRRRRRIK